MDWLNRRLMLKLIALALAVGTWITVRQILHL